MSVEISTALSGEMNNFCILSLPRKITVFVSNLTGKTSHNLSAFVNGEILDGKQHGFGRIETCL